MQSIIKYMERKTYLSVLLPKILLILLSFILMVAVSCMYFGIMYRQQPEQDAGDTIAQAWLVITALGIILAAALCALLIRNEVKTLGIMRKTAEELRLALVIAENSARTKSEFLDNMSHELRTPMNGVMGFLQVALLSPSLENQRETLIQAENSAKDLLKMINDILDYTEIESRRMETVAAPFSIAVVFNELSGTFALRTKIAGLTLNISYPVDFPPVLVGDSKKLSRVLGNLIDNAIKFTRRGKVTVRASIKEIINEQAEVEFFVRDTGIGIKPEQMKYLFEPFWQADSSVTKQYGGTGFGLALCKHLTTILGGRIWAESVYDEGATFFFTARFGLPATTMKPEDTDDNTVSLSARRKIGGSLCNVNPIAIIRSSGAV